MNVRNQNIPKELALPWCKFPRNLLCACEKGEKPETKDKNDLVHCVADYIMDDLEDKRMGIIRSVAKSICKKYPPTFSDYLGDEIIGNGVETLTKSIVNRISYLNQLKKASQNRKRNLSTEEESSADGLLAPDSSKKGGAILDSYGTVAYQPGLPQNETEATQKEKRLFLLTEFVKVQGRDQEKIDKALTDTYPSQRAAINARNSRTICSVLDDWPYLRQSPYFFEHASKLLGKNSVLIEWREQLAKHLGTLDYMKYYYNVQKKKSKGKPLDERFRSLNTILRESASAEEALNQSYPRVLALFPLLLTYFNEKNNIFKVVQKTASDDEIINAVEGATPVAVIKGISLYAKDVTCAVVVEKQICFRCGKSLTAILIAFLCYYVFGLKYPEECRKTLEFIQRAFLNINAEGAKATTGKRRKRGTTFVDAAVLKLFNTLKEDWLLDINEEENDEEPEAVKKAQGDKNAGKNGKGE